MEHPLIGAWTFALNPERRPGPHHATAAFHHDGSMSITVSGYTAHGAWQVTDSGAVRFRALAPSDPGEGHGGWHALVFDVRVDDRGAALSIDGTYERPTPSKTPLVTRLTGSGERLVVDTGS